MLVGLHISNIVLIEKLNLEFYWMRCLWRWGRVRMLG